jgi:hypothetical protein
MFFKRIVNLSALAAMVVALCAVTAGPAQAGEVVCTNRIEWWHNRYEVVATEEVECNQNSYLIVAAIAMTSPVRSSNSQGCTAVRTCFATVGTSNKAGSQTYCAEARGQYQYRSGNPVAVSRPLPYVKSCTTA